MVKFESKMVKFEATKVLNHWIFYFSKRSRKDKYYVIFYAVTYDHSNLFFGRPHCNIWQLCIYCIAANPGLLSCSSSIGCPTCHAMVQFQLWTLCSNSSSWASHTSSCMDSSRMHWCPWQWTAHSSPLWQCKSGTISCYAFQWQLNPRFHLSPKIACTWISGGCSSHSSWLVSGPGN